MKQAKCDNNFVYVSFYLLINDALRTPIFSLIALISNRLRFQSIPALSIFLEPSAMELIERLFLTVHIHCKPRTDIMIEFDKA